MHSNLKAFLDTIGWSEIGPVMLAMPETENGYRVCVGSTPSRLILMDNYTTHPRRSFPTLSSDAAGRYQFMGRFWSFYAMQLRLPDFGPESQDRWAVQLIKECKALDDVLTGHVETAITKCKSRWASFPGAGYNQRENRMDALIQVYREAGGVVA